MIEKPKDKGQTRNCIGIASDLVDGSGKVVVGGTTKRVAKAHIPCRMPKEQRNDARDANVPEAYHGNRLRPRQLEVSR